MYTKYVTGSTVTDLGTDLPWVPNYKIVALNPTASSVTLQFGDASNGPFNTAAVIPAGASAEVEIAGRYAAIENGTGQVQLLSE